MNAGANGPASVIRVRFRSRVSQPVAVAVLAPTGGVRLQRATQVWYRGNGGELIPVDGGQLTALGVSGPIGAVAFGMWSRACVTGLSVGSLQGS